MCDTFQHGSTHSGLVIMGFDRYSQMDGVAIFWSAFFCNTGVIRCYSFLEM